MRSLAGQPTPSASLDQGRGEEGGSAPSFADRAARLAGLAGVMFGWPPDAFWRATPAELAGLVRACLGDEGDAVPPDAATIARLRERFPDG